MTEDIGSHIDHLSDRALYRRSEEMLCEAARLHCSGRRSGLRKRVRRYLKPYRRDRTFLASLASSVGRALVVAYLMVQLWAAEAQAQPSFSSSSPANAKHNIAVSSNITATFSQAIASGTVSSSTFVVHGGFIGKHSTGGTASTHQDATYTGGGTTTLTFNPGKNFAPGELVQATLTTGLQNGSAQALSSARVFQFVAAAGTGPAVFSNASNNFGTGSDGTFEVVAGDVDGDGDLDLAVGNHTGQNVVYLGDGDGTFVTTGNNFGPGGGQTWTVQFGDVDGDGDLDVASAEYNSQNRVYFGDGDGTFDTTNTNYGTGIDKTVQVLLGDLDGDGDLDLVGGTYTLQNVVYMGDGDGSFDTTSHNFGTGTDNTRALALGDVDGDGDLDLFVGNNAAQNVVYLGDGDGTFDTTSNNFGTGSDATIDLTLGDVDGDGDLDLIAGNAAAQQSVVYIGDGDGTFDTTSHNIAASALGTYAVRLGDVDGDGDLDLAAGNYGSQDVVYLGDGDGTFDTTSRNLGTGSEQTSTGSLGDLDGDGDLDIVVGSRNQQNVVYLNNETAFSLSSPAANANSAATTTNISATFNKSMQAASSSTFVVHGSMTGKRAGAYSGTSSTTSTFDPTKELLPGEVVDVSLTAALKSTSGDAMQPPRVVQFRGTVLKGPTVFNLNTANIDAATNATFSMPLGDLDGDGDLDLVEGNYNELNKVYLNNGDGSLGAASNVDTPTNFTHAVSMGDLDGDGDLDLAVANRNQVNRVYLGNGSGAFASGNNIDTPTNTTNFGTLGDIDGDGDLDFIAGNYSQVNRVYLGTGSGTFATGSDVDTPTKKTFAVAFGDLDGDGDLDIAAANRDERNRVYLNNGNGTFASGSDIATPMNTTLAIMLGDLDGDGDLDMVAGNFGQANRAYLGGGDGTFDTGNNIAAPTNSTRGGELGDLDGDGDLDFVAGNQGQVNRVYLSDGDGTFASGSDVDTPTNSTISVSIVDVDGDGDLDLAMGNNAQVNRAYLNSGNKDGTLTASATLDESSAISLTSAVDTQAEAVDLFDFKLTDGAGGDGLALIVSKLVVNTSGTGAFSQVAWLLNGPDASNVNGTYSSSANTITFSGLSISVADGANETYTVRGYYSNTTGLVDGATFSLSLDGDTEITATAGSSMSGSNSAVSNAAAAKIVAPPLPTNNRGVRLSESSSVALSTNLLSFADASSSTTQIVYTVQTVPMAGTITKSGSSLGTGSTFTQDDIDNSRISYAHGGAEIFKDNFIFTVSGTPGLATGSTAFSVEIDPVNDAPALDVLREVQVDEGGTVVISNGYLRVLDGDSHGSGLNYSVHEGPFYGRLDRNTFSQSDIDQSLVRYVHDGSETQRDSLRFTVVDGNGAQVVSTWLRFAIRALNDGPIIPSIENPNIKEGELLVLDLAATDPEGASIQTTVTGLPNGATLDGTMLKWLPLYDQAGTYPLAAVYDDGDGGSSRLRIDINISDAPVPMLMPDPALVDFGDVPAGETTDQTFALVNQSPVTLELASFSSTSANLSVTSPTFPLNLPPGERTDITARFTATDDRADLQQAKLTSVAQLGIAEVPVIGRSVWRRLVAEAEEITFLPAVIGDIRWKHLNLSNPGNLPLDVLAQLPDDTAFGVEPAAITLSGGEKGIMRIRFVPVTTDAVEALLTLTSEAGQLDIPLRGQGREPEEGRVSIDFNLQNGNQQQSRIGDAIAGSVFVLQLHAKGVPTVSGWSVRVDYNPDDVSYVIGSFAPGTFLSRLLPLETVGVAYVEVGGDALDRQSPESGSGILGTLSFQVEDGFSGETELAVSRVAWRREGWVGPDRTLVYAPAEIIAGPVIFSLAGDFDEDGTVDMDDFLLFAEQFDRRVPPAEPRFDLDDDGRIGAADFFLFADLVVQEE